MSMYCRFSCARTDNVHTCSRTLQHSVKFDPEQGTKMMHSLLKKACNLPGALHTFAVESTIDSQSETVYERLSDIEV